jgi:hypothetical protein
MIANGDNGGVNITVYVHLTYSSILNNQGLINSVKNGIANNYFANEGFDSVQLNDNNNSDDNGGGLSVVTILAIVIGVIFLISLAIIVALGIYIASKNRRRPRNYEAVEISEETLRGKGSSRARIVIDDDGEEGETIKGVSYANIMTPPVDDDDNDRHAYTVSNLYHD